MDSLETALLRPAGLRGHMDMLSSAIARESYETQQSPLSAFSLEGPVPCVATDRSGLLLEDFSVDDLLDLGGCAKEQDGSKEEGFLQLGEAAEEEEEREERDGCSNSNTSSLALSFQAAPPLSEPMLPVRTSLPFVPSSGSPAQEQKDHFFFGSLTLYPAVLETTQAGDAEDLEWVSRFVDDCYSDFTSAAVTSSFGNHHPLVPSFPVAAAESEAPKVHSTANSSRPLKRSWRRFCFSTESVVVPARARSNRLRTGGRVWSLSRPPLLSEPSSSSCSSASSTSSCSGSSSVTSCLLFGKLSGGGWNPDRFSGCLGGGPLIQHQLPQLQLKRKTEGKPTAIAGGTTVGAEKQVRRRCTHCGVDKTPQWRAGPMGAKTLCNACGVRYKSGRLLPEYRPACSPTFVSHVHSNSHRKVLEIRRNRELLATAASAPASGSASRSTSPPQPVAATRPYGVV